MVNGVCERCGGQVVRKVKSQWMLRITAYAQKLLDGLDNVDFIERVKTQQRNWIGRSEGAEVDFRIAGKDEKLRVYTTRPDTLFGATYMVVSPEHPMIEKYKDGHRAILTRSWPTGPRPPSKSDFERTELNKDKTGVQIDGLKAVNPVNGREIPIWVSDYVLMGYGTGAIMAVPAHDTRDWAFAKKFGMPMIEVVAGGDVDQGSLHRHRGRHHGQLRLPERPAGGRRQEEDHRMADGEGRGRAEGQLQAARLGVQPPALLGRAYPAGALPPLRHACPCPRISCPCCCPTWKTTSPPTTAKAPCPP